MGFWGKLFGTDAAIEKGIDVVSRGLDALVYTEEEKSADAMKERAEARGMIIDWMRSTQGQNLARRMLALVITATWLLMYLLAAGLDLVTIWAVENVDKLSRSAEMIGGRATQMNGAMMLILGFYFAAPHLGQLIGPAIERFAGGKKQ